MDGTEREVKWGRGKTKDKLKRADKEMEMRGEVETRAKNKEGRV